MSDLMKFVIFAFLGFDALVALLYYLLYIREAKKKQGTWERKPQVETDDDDFDEMMKKIIEEDKRLKEEEKAKLEQAKKQPKKA